MCSNCSEDVAVLGLVEEVTELGNAGTGKEVHHDFESVVAAQNDEHVGDFDCDRATYLHKPRHEGFMKVAEPVVMIDDKLHVRETLFDSVVQAHVKHQSTGKPKENNLHVDRIFADSLTVRELVQEEGDAKHLGEEAEVALDDQALTVLLDLRFQVSILGIVWFFVCFFQ